MSKDVLHNGNIAYAKVSTENSLIRQMIEAYEYPVYGFDIVFPNADKNIKETHKNTYWQRVPDLDIINEETASIIR